MIRYSHLANQFVRDDDNERADETFSHQLHQFADHRKKLGDSNAADIAYGFARHIEYTLTLEKLLCVITFPKSTKTRGRPPTTYKISRPIGRPKKWTPDRYDFLMKAREMGEQLLREEYPHAKITDEDALAKAARHFMPTRAVHQITTEARKLAKRLPDARKSVRKL